MSTRLALSFCLPLSVLFCTLAYTHDAPFVHDHGQLEPPVGVVLAPPPTEPIWSTPARLFVSRCIADDLPPPGSAAPQGGPSVGANNHLTIPPGGLGGLGGIEGIGLCGRKPVSNDESITWTYPNDLRNTIRPNGKVRFGPFRLIRKGVGKAARTSDDYTIRIYAQTHDRYRWAANGEVEYVGPEPQFRVIAEKTVTLTGTDEQTVFIDTKVPGVFTAIRIKAMVGDEASVFPARCGEVAAGNAANFHSSCLQARLLPLGVISQEWLPISIIYEPPGNCSWSNLTQTHAAGATIASSRTVASTERVESNPGAITGESGIDFDSGDSTSSMSGLTVRTSWSSRLGTALAQSTSPGNPDCVTTGADLPPRDQAGPGLGDKFVLLHDVELVYWETGEFTSTAWSPLARPGLFEPVTLSAHQLRSGTGLPAGTTISQSDRDQILSLSPFQISDSGTIEIAVDSDRYIPVVERQVVTQGNAVSHTISDEFSLSDQDTITSFIQSEDKRIDSDPAFEVAMQATLGLIGTGTDFKKPLDQVLGTIVGERDTITTSTRYTTANLIQRTESDSVTQQFHIHDTNAGMRISIFYDRLFGTFVYVPVDPDGEPIPISF